ncbi:hypothetical protein JY97_04330 [Alkalispirochaeta odontotermitis]|nr:hypothetical protein JY97_04330 [Alkalispirochaeta odontotermitis]CAB1083474.1 hypothetical protein D1AOALGA4SA_11036 [Olavius algarvensis Delta 1 endosymbiont]
MIALLDTGPWVALIDRSESRHTECVNWLRAFSGRLYSTEAVLTEVLYLLNFSITAQCAAMDFVLKSVVEIVPANINSLKKTKTLMKKYADLPMDFADATLVCLAAETGLQNVVTFDRRDLAIYKLPRKQSFTVMP